MSGVEWSVLAITLAVQTILQVAAAAIAWWIYKSQTDRKLKVRDSYLTEMLGEPGTALIPIGHYIVQVVERRGDLVKATIMSSPRDPMLPNDLEPGALPGYDGEGRRISVVADARYLTDAVIEGGYHFLAVKGVFGLTYKPPVTGT